MEPEREIDINLVTPNDPAVGEVVENRLVTDSSSPHYTRHWVADVSGTELEGNFEVGQAFGVIPEWDHYVDYNKLNIQSDDRKLRLYSVASPTSGEEGNGQYISTTVKRVFDEHWDTGETFLGVCSNYMCDMDVGDKVKLTGPTGRHFVLPDKEERDEYNYVFLATGTGIAPFRGMSMELLEQGIENDIYLVLGVPYRTDVLYGDFFKELDEKHDNFHFMEALSRNQKTEDGNKMYVQERMLAERDVFEPLLNQENTLTYICGLKGMETGIYRAMLMMGADDLVEVPSDEDLDWSKMDDRAPIFDNVSPNDERNLVEVY